LLCASDECAVTVFFLVGVIFQVYVKVQWLYSGKDVGDVVKSLYVFRFVLFLHLTRPT
jgi:hypothetical protein